MSFGIFGGGASSDPNLPGRSGLATASLAMAVIAAFSPVIFASWPALAAVVLGHLSLREIRARGLRGQGLARAGLSVGYFFLTIVAYANFRH